MFFDLRRRSGGVSVGGNSTDGTSSRSFGGHGLGGLERLILFVHSIEALVGRRFWNTVKDNHGSRIFYRTLFVLDFDIEEVGSFLFEVSYLYLFVAPSFVILCGTVPHDGTTSNRKKEELRRFPHTNFWQCLLADAGLRSPKAQLGENMLVKSNT